MTRPQRTTLRWIALGQFVVAAIMSRYHGGTAVLFLALGVAMLRAADRSPGPPRRAKSRAKKR